MIANGADMFGERPAELTIAPADGGRRCSTPGPPTNYVTPPEPASPLTPRTPDALLAGAAARAAGGPRPVAPAVPPMIAPMIAPVPVVPAVEVRTPSWWRTRRKSPSSSSPASACHHPKTL